MSQLPSPIAVLGSGTMGPGIAATLVRAGATVRLYDISQEIIDRAAGSYKFASGVLDQLDLPVVDGGEVVFTTDFAEALADVKFVIEAVPENLDLKKKVIADMEAIIGDEVIISTNTSGIPISAMSADMQHPGRLVGMHWSNPPHLIPMIEVIPGEKTDDSAVQETIAIVKAIGYHAVQEKEIAGFVENRVLYAILRECVAMLNEGIVSPEGLDTCVKWGIGYKLSVIGPTRLLDMAGMDIYAAVSSYLNAQLDNSAETPAVITDLIAQGRLGFKSGAGMYDYGPGDVDAKRRDIVAGLVAARKTLSAITPV